MENGKIYEAISNVMSEIGAIGKDKKNPQQGFMYRGIDDVMNALQPALVKYKVFITPEITSETREERTNKNGTLLFYVRLGITYHFMTIDGSEVLAKVIGEAMDSGDKATNKAMSIGYKYACFQVFCIPTEEMIDPDGEVHDLGKNKSAESPKQTEPPKQAAKSTAKQSGKQTAPPAEKQQTTPPANQIPSEKEMADVANKYISDEKIITIRKEIHRIGITEEAVCSRYKVAMLADITEGLFPTVMNALLKSKTKEV